MSSTFVRSQFKGWLAANATTEKVVDLTLLYQSEALSLAQYGVGPEDSWCGISFQGGTENGITLPALNNQGKYRETGTVSLHLVEPTSLVAADAILARFETLRALLRGIRIGTILIESVSLINFGAGATLEVKGGYSSGTFIVAYEYDVNL